jgi:hypothetical protein
MRPCAAPVFAAVLALPAGAHAGMILSQGNVTPLTDVSQMGPAIGTAEFDEGPTNGAVPEDAYSADGLTFHKGPLAQVLAGVTTQGMAIGPSYATNNNYFPMLMGGGVQAGQIQNLGGVATFTGPVTQVGLTASKNGKQYLTVWDTDGVMIGQVQWIPAMDSSFVGLDTNGVEIGMFAFGNDDLWNGATYDASGLNIYSDTWIWSDGGVQAMCQDDEMCADANLCNGVEVCTAGTCAAGTPIACADDLVCTDDLCDPVTGCMTKPIPDCCTLDEMCEPDELCDGVSHKCVPLDMGTSSGETSSASTGTGETSNSTTTSSTGEPATDTTTAPDAGTTTEDPTSATPTTSSGETTLAPGSTSGDSSGTGSESTDLAPEPTACTCTARGGAPGLWLLALLARPRRRRGAT